MTVMKMANSSNLVEPCEISPTPGEVMPSIAHLECLVAEVQFAPLLKGVLLVDVAPQLGGVLHVGVGNDEGIALLCAVTLGRLENLQQHFLVLGLQLIIFAGTEARPKVTLVSKEPGAPLHGGMEPKRSGLLRSNLSKFRSTP